MNLKTFFLIFIIGLVSGRSQPLGNTKLYDTDFEGKIISDGHTVDIPASSHKKGFSAGSGLRSIAQGSANQAFTAVANQKAAGIQAAYVAQSTLAQAAAQAAATAQAALTGKEVLLHSLEEQLEYAHESLEAQIAQLQQSKNSADIAKTSAQQAAHHVSVLTSALNSAQIFAELAESAANEASVLSAGGSALVGKAKAKLEEMHELVDAARIDFEATKEATHNALSAAKEAHTNAEAAAAQATVELHEPAPQKPSAEELSINYPDLST